MSLREALSRRGVDVFVAVVLVAMVVEVARDSEAPGWLAYASVLLATIPLFFRARLGVLAPLSAMLGVALLGQFYNAGSQTVAALAVLLLACWLLGTASDRAHGMAGLVAAFTLALVTVDGNPGPLTLADVFFTVLVVGAPFVAASAYRARGLRTAEVAAKAADEAISTERARMARELHDVVGHALGVIALQAGGARLQVDQDPNRARESMCTIEEVAHEALDEMRRLVRVLREVSDEDYGPTPGLANVGDLVARLTASGLSVDIETYGEPRRLPPGIDLATFRLIQEALTNVVKHGVGTACLVLRYTGDGLNLELTNAIRPEPQPGAGYGLAGMRERLALYGGTLETSARDGVFRLRAVLPITAAVP